MEIFKFGGSALQNPTTIRQCIHLIDHPRNQPLVIVVSAMDKTTRGLEHILHLYLQGQSPELAIEEIYLFHQQIVTALLGTHGACLQNTLQDWKTRLLHELATTPIPTTIDDIEQLYSKIVAWGELISSTIVHQYMVHIGLPVTWVDARNYIKTKVGYTNAQLDQTLTSALVQTQLLPRLNQDEWVITQGFIGSNAQGATTTLGKEGSDFTGAILAATLNAQSLTIWKDVPGIMNADPKIFKDAKVFHSLSYETMATMSFYGAQVVHPKTIRPLAMSNIPLYIRSFYHPEDTGTRVGNQPSEIINLPIYIVRKDQVCLQVQIGEFEFFETTHLATLFQACDQLALSIFFLEKTPYGATICLPNDPIRLAQLLTTLRNQFSTIIHEDVHILTILGPYDVDEWEGIQKAHIITTQRTASACQLIINQGLDSMPSAPVGLNPPSLGIQAILLQCFHKDGHLPLTVVSFPSPRSGLLHGLQNCLLLFIGCNYNIFYHKPQHQEDISTLFLAQIFLGPHQVVKKYKALLLILRILNQYPYSLMKKIKTYGLLFLKGVGMGTVEVVPGISSSTIALVTGIYTELLATLQSFDKTALQFIIHGRWKQLWTHVHGHFLFPLLIGMTGSLLTTAKLVQHLLSAYPIQIWSFFFGLSLVATMLIYQQIQHNNLSTWCLYGIGSLLAYYATQMSPLSSSNASWFIFIAGAISVCAMILPGISGSFMLLILGKYAYMLEALENLHWPTLATFILGGSCGLLIFSKWLFLLLQRYTQSTLAFLAGFMVGALPKTWPWKILRSTTTTELQQAIEYNVSPAYFQLITHQHPHLLQAVFSIALGAFMVLLLKKLGNLTMPSDKIRIEPSNVPHLTEVTDALHEPITETLTATRNLYIESYGCQMNIADSEVVVSILKPHHFVMTDQYEQADVIFLNTCAIRDKAEQTIRKRLAQFNQLKKRNPALVIGVLGCMAERLKQTLLEEEKLVDLVAGPDAYRDLPRLVTTVDSGSKAINTFLSREETYADISPVRLNSNGVSAFISIMRGCDNMCSFCIVPFTRGRERSRDPYSIVKEATQLFEEGYREVTLLGQNVDSYKWSPSVEKQDLPHLLPLHPVTFAQLLTMVAQIDPALRIRFSTSHPKDITDEVLYTMKAYDNICKYIHLPVQSGNSRILELMNRTYDRSWYLERIAAIRRIVGEDCGISSDMIAGFCSETEEEHQDTLSLMDQVKYDFSYMFYYSERPGTLAARKYADDIPLDVKKRRLQEIIDKQRQHSRESNQRDIGKVYQVLVEGPSKKSPTEWQGRNSANKVVVFPNQACVKGTYVTVRITDCTPATLLGEVDNA
eukprot:gene143-192_t